MKVLSVASLSAVALLLPLAIVTAQQADARAASCAASDAELMAALRVTHDKQQNVGLGSAIMRNGQLVFTGNLGFADLEHRVPVTDDTRFGVASITKAFTGVALLKAVAEGKIDLDQPIQRYVRGFPEHNDGVVTPRLVMAHLGGIRHWHHDGRRREYYDDHITDVMDILPLFKDDAFSGTPGRSYNYSSHGYNLLAMAIQSATGKPFQEYVGENIFEPLGLTTTAFDNVQAVIHNRARRYSFYHPITREENDGILFRIPEWDYSHNMAGGNMITTASDLARFGNALVRPGLLTGATFDLLYTSNATERAESPWSVGFFYRPAGEDSRRINITGANDGLQAALYVFPDDELVVVVLSNSWGLNSRSAEMVVDLPERLASLCLMGTTH